MVRSTAVSILQHDAFTWQLSGPHFEELQQVDAGSQIMDETVHAWLRNATPSSARPFFYAPTQTTSRFHNSPPPTISPPPPWSRNAQDFTT